MVTRPFARELVTSDSGPIAKLSYSFDERRLRVAFRSGSVWDYVGVPAATFGLLAGAFSVGAVFNEQIRDRFDAIKVETAENEVRTLKAKKGPKRARTVRRTPPG